MRVNLIEEKKTKVSFDVLRVGIVLSILIMFGVISLVHINLVLEKNFYTEEINRLDSQLNVYLPKEREYKTVKAKIEEIKALPVVPEYKWDGPIEALGYITPLGGVIKNFSLQNRELNIEGTTTVAEELREFSIAVADSPFFKNVKLNTLKKENEVEFLITAQLVEEEVD